MLQHKEILEIRRAGLFFAIEMQSAERVQKVVEKCLEKGLIGFWFLSCPNSFRLSPPISITTQELTMAAELIIAAIEETA